MGGFRFNGCGATDHFKKLKSLGVHECPSCHRQAEIFLDQANFKVDIFFIPTVTLKSRYAVMCSKCENGKYISDTLATRILNGGSYELLFEDSQSGQTTGQSTGQMNQSMQTALPYGGAGSQTNAASTYTCPHCGKAQKAGGKFCTFCGKPVTTGTAPKPATAARKCPSCGAVVKPGDIFCDKCGKRLEMQV